MPEEGIDIQPKETLLTYTEIATLARLFVRLGVRKIRITGGEPLVRRDIEQLFVELGAINELEELAISTNALLLKEKLPALWNAGVSQLNISLDTLRADRFFSITRRDTFSDVVDAIRRTVQYQGDPSKKGFRSVKLNMVVMRGINDDELIDFIRFGEELTQLASSVGPAIEVRFIEFMPFPHNGWDYGKCVSYNEMREAIQVEYRLEPVTASSGVHGPAKTFRVGASKLHIGFITSNTDNFCGDCNRLRLTADGNFRSCLFGTDGVSLRDMLRSGATEVQMEQAIRSSLSLKWEKHPDAQELIQIGDRDMIMIGG